MRVLLITGAYPPDVTGGWDQLVEEVADGLEAMGHEIRVLTSCADGPPSDDGRIARRLSQEAHREHYRPAALFGYAGRLESNLLACRELTTEFEPDVVFVHSMWNMTRGVAWQAERLRPGRVVYYMADHWILHPDPHESYWREAAGGLPKTLAKRALAWPAEAWVRRCNRKFELRLERVLCVSRVIRDELKSAVGLAESRLRVVRNGVDLEQFRWTDREPTPDRTSLLYVGSLVPDKGVETAVRALGVLKSRGRLLGTTLDVVGRGHSGYERSLRATAQELGLTDVVRFRGAVRREDVPSLLSGFDAMVFPSEWEEPLARSIQEAMACGLPVIGTLTGGTGELLVDGQTGFTFEAGSQSGLAEAIERVRRSPQEALRVARAARQEIERRFDVRSTIAGIERELNDVLHGADARRWSEPAPTLPPGAHRIAQAPL